MRIITALVALGLMLGATVTAKAQGQTLPPNTILGRTGITPGPAQAIPFASFGPLIAPFVPGGVTAGLTNQLAYYPNNAASVAGIGASSFFDTVFCNTNGQVLTRGSSAWGCAPPAPLSIIYADNFGTTHDGVTDDAVPLQNALAACQGGAVYLGPYQYFSSLALIVPRTCSLVCPEGWSGSGGGPAPASPTYDFMATPCTIRIPSTATIGLRGTIRGIAIINTVYTVKPATTRAALTLVSSYAGVGITAGGSGNGDDAFVDNVFVGGFTTCYVNGTSNNGFRIWINQLTGDCTNGIAFNGSHDVSHIHNAHFWPFFTVIVPNVAYQVTGVASDGGLVKITYNTNANLTLQTGDHVCISELSGAWGVNGCWTVTVIDTTHVDLQGSHFGSVSYTCTTTNGTKALTSCAGNTSVHVGQVVSGTNIPGGTIVTHVVPLLNKVYISNAATGSAANSMTFTDSAYAAHGGSCPSGQGSGIECMYVDAYLRSGAGMTFANTDTALITNSFVNEYTTGVHLSTNAFGIRFANFLIDGNAQTADPASIGFLIDNFAAGTTVSACGLSAMVTGVLVNTSNIQGNSFTSCEFHELTTQTYNSQNWGVGADCEQGVLLVAASMSPDIWTTTNTIGASCKDTTFTGVFAQDSTIQIEAATNSNLSVAQSYMAQFQIGGSTTIGALPTCNAVTNGSRYVVTNGQTTPPFLGAVSTTGAVIAPVVCNGSGWIYG